MPFRTEWIASDVFLRYKGVTIHHVHKDDDVEMFMRPYSYGYAKQCSDEGDLAFDVREFPNPHDRDVNRPNGCRAIIRAAIDACILTQDGIQGEPTCPEPAP